jgi:hypothetical protein
VKPDKHEKIECWVRNFNELCKTKRFVRGAEIDYQNRVVLVETKSAIISIPFRAIPTT